MSKRVRTAVLGTGSWGSALAHHLTIAGHDVVLWGIDKAALRSIKEQQFNPGYLENHLLAPGISPESDLSTAIGPAHMIVLATPSSAFRELARTMKPKINPQARVVSAAKGLEEGSLKRMSEVLEDELGQSSKIAVLSGPSFAMEVVQGFPTAVTVAAKDRSVADEVAELFHYDYFRVYTSTDLVGVECGGVMKNVIALATGVVDGMGMGANARAALVTRGLAEMQRLAMALGADPRTLVGLSGLGDLLLTATGDLSRNRQVGLGLGKGEKLEDILERIGQVAEGVMATPSILTLAEQHNVHLPIALEVQKILNCECTVRESVDALLSRTRSSEIKN